MFSIPCVIFAGGRSSRMGEDKALLPFSTFSTLTQYQLHRLQKIFTHIYISTKDISKFNFKANFILDKQSNSTYAPTAGFVASFEHLEENSFFAISVDTPFISEEIIEQLIHAHNNNYDATIAKTTDGIQPLCGIYNRSIKESFLTMQKSNTHKLGMLLRNSKTQYLHFSNDTRFLNLNTQEDYAKALTLV